MFWRRCLACNCAHGFSTSRGISVRRGSPLFRGLGIYLLRECSKELPQRPCCPHLIDWVQPASFSASKRVCRLLLYELSEGELTCFPWEDGISECEGSRLAEEAKSSFGVHGFALKEHTASQLFHHLILFILSRLILSNLERCNSQFDLNHSSSIVILVKWFGR